MCSVWRSGYRSLIYERSDGPDGCEPKKAIEWKFQTALAELGDAMILRMGISISNEYSHSCR